MENPNALKKIPIAITKDQLIKMFHPIPEREILDSINLIIVDRRKDLPRYVGKNPNEIKKTKTVYKRELLLFIKEYDLPTGFEI